MAALRNPADVEPLVGALADLTVSVARIAAASVSDWAAVGPLTWTVPGPTEHLTCALCGQPIVDLHRAAEDGSGRVAHYDPAECLDMIRRIVGFVLDTYIPPVERVADSDPIPF